MNGPKSIYDFQSNLEEALEFLKRTRWELRDLHFVRVFKDKFQIHDVNRDYFEIRGVGYPHPDIAPLLHAVNTAFDPDTIANETKLEFKEFKTGRRWAWAADRAM